MPRLGNTGKPDTLVGTSTGGKERQGKPALNQDAEEKSRNAVNAEEIVWVLTTEDGGRWAASRGPAQHRCIRVSPSRTWLYFV